MKADNARTKHLGTIAPPRSSELVFLLLMSDTCFLNVSVSPVVIKIPQQPRLLDR